MGYLDINHENMEITKTIVRGRVVYTIDNFYRYPNAISSKYISKRRTNSIFNYPGHKTFLTDNFGESDVNEHYAEFEAFVRSLGYKTLPRLKDNTPCFSQYDHSIGVQVTNTFLNRKKGGEMVKLPFNGENDVIDERFIRQCKAEGLIEKRGTMNNPHVDTDPRSAPYLSLACLCYLTKDKEAHGGTGLYYNKALDTFSRDLNFETRFESKLWNSLQNTTTCEEKADAIESHFCNLQQLLYPRFHSDPTIHLSDSDEYFDLVHFFPMKFNRMILYEGDIMHGLYIKDPDHFKTRLRLTTNYFFTMEWDYSSITEEDALTEEQSSLLTSEIQSACKKYPSVTAAVRYIKSESRNMLHQPKGYL
jgi:hypothetical protein